MNDYKNPDKHPFSQDLISSRDQSLTVVLAYAAFSGLYILVSDRLVTFFFSDPDQIALISIAKGWMFVGITSCLLYFMMRKQFQKAIDAAEQKRLLDQEKLNALHLLDSIAANSTDAIFAKDSQGRYLLFNQQAEKISRKSMHDVLGKDDTYIFSAEEAKKIIENEREVMANNQTVTITEHLKLAGKEYTFLSTKGPLNDANGNVVGLFGIVRDVSEIAKAIKALKENEAILNQMSRMAKVGGWEFDVSTMQGTWTEEIANIYDADEVGEISVDYGLSVFNGEWLEMIEHAVNKAIEESIPYDLELEMMTHKGNKKWVRTVGIPVEVDGKVTSLHGFMQDVTAQKQTEQELHVWDKASKSAEFGLAVIDSATNLFRIVNPAFARQRGYLPEELIGQSSQIIYPTDAHENALDRISGLEQTGHCTFETLHIRKDGSEFPVLMDVTLIRSSENGQSSRFIYAIDISERKAAEQQLSMWGQAFESAEFALAIANPDDNTFMAVNPTFAMQRGYEVSELVGQSIMKLYPSNMHEEIVQRIHDIDKAGHGVFEAIHLTKTGQAFPVLIDVTVTKSPSGKPISRLAYALDISERKQAEAQIHHLAYFDGLTGLPNRLLLADRISQVVAMADRDLMQSALILLNIDHFKNLNDALGHSRGDLLLKAVAERLGNLLREGDTLARFGGDEFAILLHALDTTTTQASHHAALVASKIHNALRNSFTIEDDEIFITAGLGITLFPEGERDVADAILRRADTALHRAKQHGGNETVFFESAMGRAVEQHFLIERELHKGIESSELRLYLQSQVDAAGKMLGAEALVRWQHPERGLVSPALFISIAEDSDLICEIDNWVFTEVCRFLASDIAEQHSVRIAVNISTRHFRQPGFIEWIKGILLTTGANPHLITLEVTESLVIQDVNNVISKMLELRSLGIHFSIDDFGTGYSSLSYLKNLPIDELKIDKVFVQDAPNDQDDAVLVETILAVAKQLKLRVVAEGVETIEQAEFLNSRASVIHQGYFYGKPLPVDEWLTVNLHETGVLT